MQSFEAGPSECKVFHGPARTAAFLPLTSDPPSSNYRGSSTRGPQRVTLVAGAGWEGTKGR